MKANSSIINWEISKELMDKFPFLKWSPPKDSVGLYRKLLWFLCKNVNFKKKEDRLVHALDGYITIKTAGFTYLIIYFKLPFQQN